MQSVLQDSNKSRMKLLCSKAIPDGIEARQSLNCFECSVHAWMLARASVTIPGCVSTALKRICSHWRWTRLSTREAMSETQERLRLRSSLQSMFVYTCTTLSRSPHSKQLDRPVSNHRYPDLACDYPAPLAPMQCLTHLSTETVGLLRPVPPTEAPPADSALSWRCSS